MPPFSLRAANRIHLELPAAWLDANPLTAHLLEQERAEWKSVGTDLRLVAG